MDREEGNAQNRVERQEEVRTRKQRKEEVDAVTEEGREPDRPAELGLTRLCEGQGVGHGRQRVAWRFVVAWGLRSDREEVEGTSGRVQVEVEMARAEGVAVVWPARVASSPCALCTDRDTAPEGAARGVRSSAQSHRGSEWKLRVWRKKEEEDQQEEDGLQPLVVEEEGMRVAAVEKADRTADDLAQSTVKEEAACGTTS